MDAITGRLWTRGSGLRSRARLAILLAGIVAACSAFPPGVPADAVRAAMERVVAHDLAGASLLVCAERRDPEAFPFTIPGVFAPLQALPGSDIGRTLSVIRFDASRLTITERSRDGDRADADVSGVLVERFNPAEVEALFRAYAAESGQPIEPDLLRETIDNVSRGDVALDVRVTIPVVREGGQWKVCPPVPTP